MRQPRHVQSPNIEDISLPDSLEEMSSRHTQQRLWGRLKLPGQLQEHLSGRLKLLEPRGVVMVLLPLFAFCLWATSLQHVSVYAMNALGLISVLSPRIIVALVILTISFVLCLQQPQLRIPILALHVLLVIIMLYGVENLIEEAPRFSIVYRHAGYTEYIMRTGTVNPNLDAYFSWPGFFVLSAFVTQVAGYSSILSYAGWAPVFYNVIYFGPMYMIFSAMTTNKRLIWLALWFFYVTNWIGQDYFSPQGLNFFLYIVIIAILLKWFKIAPKARPTWFKVPSRGQPTWFKPPAKTWLPGQKQPWRLHKMFTAGYSWCLNWLRAPDTLSMAVRPWQRCCLLVSLILVFALVVYSHPLTPFFVLASVTALVVFRRCYPFWLPVLVAAMTLGWIHFMTQTFLAGHSSMVTGQIGDVTKNMSSAVTQRVVQGDPLHTFIAELRVIMTGFIWGLAFLGAALRLRRGYKDISYILLAIAPFPLIVAQSYGGEMFLRVYLFALPFMVFFAAALFYSKHTLITRKTSQWLTIAIIVMNLLLLTGFFFTRYGNEQMDYITYAEWNGIQYLYGIAPPKSLLIEGWYDTPWQYKDYEKYTCIALTDVAPNSVLNVNVDELIRYVKSQRNPHSYLVFSRSEKAQAYSLSGVPNGALDRLEVAMLKSGEFKLLYTNPDAQIFLFTGGTK